LAAASVLGLAPSVCPATVVRYDTAIPAVPAATLPSYVRSLRDGRVNGSDGLVLWQAGSTVVWRKPGTVVARRLDGPGVFRTRAATLRFPSAGCWRLAVRKASVVAHVVDVPQKLGCDATLLEDGKAYVRPRAAGIWGGWPWQSTGPAQLTTHGHDGDRNMKVPWWVDRKAGGSLTLVGTRLDASGSFRQVFQMAGAPERVYPSIVDIPAAGCWLLRLRTGKLAGVLVVRAVDAHG